MFCLSLKRAWLTVWCCCSEIVGSVCYRTAPVESGSPNAYSPSHWAEPGTHTHTYPYKKHLCVLFGVCVSVCARTLSLWISSFLAVRSALSSANSTSIVIMDERRLSSSFSWFSNSWDSSVLKQRGVWGVYTHTHTRWYLHTPVLHIKIQSLKNCITLLYIYLFMFTYHSIH